MSDRLHRFQDIIAAATGSVDVAELRRICAEGGFVQCIAHAGIPDKPYQLRPTLWSLLLGTLPADKARWTDTQADARNQYYVRVVLYPH
jgi:hypothetical protein